MICMFCKQQMQANTLYTDICKNHDTIVWFNGVGSAELHFHFQIAAGYELYQVDFYQYQDYKVFNLEKRNKTNTEGTRICRFSFHPDITPENFKQKLPMLKVFS